MKCLLFSRFSWPKVVCLKEQIYLAVAFSDTNILECLIQMLWWNAGLECFGGLEWFATNAQTHLTVAFSGTCTGIPNTMLWWPRMVCFATNAQINLTVAAQALWNAYCFPGLVGLRLFVCKRKQICLAVAFSDTNRLECLIQSFGGLEWFVCNKCTNKPRCCFQRNKCTGMPNTKLWWP